MSDYYEILGISKTASEEEIKKAYRDAAKKNHPDLNPDDSQATQRFQKIQEAYDILSDPIKKSHYDGKRMHFRQRSNPAESQNTTHNNNDFFSNSVYKGRNVSVKIDINFYEILKGCTKDILVKKRLRCISCNGDGAKTFKKCQSCDGVGSVRISEVPLQIVGNCPICSGTGVLPDQNCADCEGTGFLPNITEKLLHVFIPPGADHGSVLKVAGEGEESKQGGRFGDLIIHIIVKQHEYFTRDGINLLLDVPVTYTQLALGCELEIPTLVDNFVKIKIPAGSQTHTKYRLKGKGLSSNNSIGDLIVTLKLETPKTVTIEHKNTLEELKVYEFKARMPKRDLYNKKINKKSNKKD